MTKEFIVIIAFVIMNFIMYTYTLKYIRVTRDDESDEEFNGYMHSNLVRLGYLKEIFSTKELIFIAIANIVLLILTINLRHSNVLELVKIAAVSISMVYLSITDLRYKEVPDMVTGGVLILNLVITCFNNNFLGIIAGAGAFSLMFVLMGGYGYNFTGNDIFSWGDIKAIIIIGTAFSISLKSVFLFIVGMLIASIAVLVINTIRKKKETFIPFIPIIFVGMLTFFTGWG